MEQSAIAIRNAHMKPGACRLLSICDQWFNTLMVNQEVRDIFNTDD